MNKLISFLGRTRFQFGRGYQYIATVSILFLVATELQKWTVFKNFRMWQLLLLGLIMVWFVFGYLIDYKLGVIKAEQQYWGDMTPGMRKILERLERIEEKLDGRWGPPDFPPKDL